MQNVIMMINEELHNLLKHMHPIPFMGKQMSLKKFLREREWHLHLSALTQLVYLFISAQKYCWCQCILVAKVTL